MSGGTAIWEKIAQFLHENGQASLVTLLDVRGSSPRETGARMAIRADGRFTGTIGGGALEWLALAQAQSLMRSARDGAGRLHAVSLGPDLGQCCGGRVSLLIEAFSAQDLGWIVQLAHEQANAHERANIHEQANMPVNTQACADERGVFRRRRVADAAAGKSALLTGGILYECFGEAPTSLLLFGAGHVGRALVLGLAPLPVITRWIDPRRGEFPEAFPSNVTPIAPDDPVREVAHAPDGSMLLAMTHSHALDLAIVAAGLRNPAIREIGVIGSTTKRARFVSQLTQAGFDTDQIDRMHCPIGLGGLKSKAPAIIALGVAAQIMEWREAQGALFANMNRSVGGAYAHRTS